MKIEDIQKARIENKKAILENKRVEDFLEYLNPMSESALDKLLSDTPQLLEDCVSYFSSKIVSGDVKGYLSGRESS